MEKVSFINSEISITLKFTLTCLNHFISWTDSIATILTRDYRNVVGSATWHMDTAERVCAVASVIAIGRDGLCYVANTSHAGGPVHWDSVGSAVYICTDGLRRTWGWRHTPQSTHRSKMLHSGLYVYGKENKRKDPGHYYSLSQKLSMKISNVCNFSK